MRIAALVFASLAAVAVGQRAGLAAPSTTPVPILKQINQHNEDGSYSYGYEGADGSFKIETKYPTGEVYGKYGYIDSNGEKREIEYGATKRGFEPAGTGINVPPATIGGDNNNQAYSSDDYDDGSYREDPRIYNEYEQQYKGNNVQQVPTPVVRARTYAPAAPAPAPRQPQQQVFQQQRAFVAPAPVNPHLNHNPFVGHPAANVNLNTGSYSLSYSG
ncbi:uncharacterized protein LOC132199375 isoform X1 [Neocloeon triangulifer]|uniref:uncharacterized protein LOC132199375 isoform X1 n=1 Tax=Neocloeon triangulifer TaxID=2078957 RepID=UPI00286F2C31|nr:uncharacterized protein LOC132199375 isoform X1 [Neocloeon triangulifer]